MKSLNIISSLLLFLNFSLLNAQTLSPVGEWSLSKHYVYCENDSNTIEEMVIELDKSIVFQLNDRYILTYADSIEYGEWHLNKRGNKLIFNPDNGYKYSIRENSPIDFNSEIYLLEYVDIKYREEQKEKWRGTSEFIRKKSALNAIDTSKLVGKWEIKEIQIGKKSRKYKGSFYFEIVQEQETNLKKYRGRWNSPLLKIYGDFLYDKEKWTPSYNYYIEEIKENSFKMIIVERKKIEVLYMTRLK